MRIAWAMAMAGVSAGMFAPARVVWAEAPSATVPADSVTQNAPAPVSAPERLDDRFQSYNGLRPELQSAGLTILGTDILDFSKNVSGGADTHANILRNLADLRLTFDPGALTGWKGATFFLDAQNLSGVNGSSRVGDAQGFDSIDAANNRSQVAELWYQQFFLDNRFRLKIGKMDGDTDFAQPTYTNLFLNGSWGYSPTITNFPTYPDNAFGVNVFVTPVDWFYAGAGIYDGGGPRGFRTGSFGPSKILHSGESVFAIGEMGVKWQLGGGTLPGRVAVGESYDDRAYAALDNSRATHSGAASFYAVAEQQLWHANAGDKADPAGIYASFQYGHGDPHGSEFVDHYALALIWTAPYTKDNPDSIGVGVSAVHLSEGGNSPATRDYETAVEGYYNFQMTKYFALRPDVQYILGPGGTTNADHALVLTLRVVFNF